MQDRPEKITADQGHDDAVAPAPGQPSKPAQTASFEVLLAQLGDIVNRLEGGGLGLSESIEFYERGVTILRHLHEELAGAEQRVRTLTGVDEEGRPISAADEGPGRTVETSDAAAFGRTDPASGTEAEASALRTAARRRSPGRPARSKPLPGMDGDSDDA